MVFNKREDFKKLLGNDIIEFYIHTFASRERDSFKAIAYVPPQENFIDIDTTFDTPEDSFKKILDAI